MESFDWAIWRFVWKDAVSGLWDKWRVIKEAAVSLSVGYVIFPLFGSADSSSDFAVEKLLVVPATLAVMMLVHALWSWVSGPRRLFYQQSERLAELTKSEAISKAAAKNEQLGIVHTHLRDLINRCDELADQHEMAARIVEAEDLIRGLIPTFLPRLVRAWPQQHALSPASTLQDEVGFGRFIASLKVIDGTITVDDLPIRPTG
jgi:hypothetical protein